MWGGTARTHTKTGKRCAWLTGRPSSWLSTLLGVGGRLGVGWGPTHPTDPRKETKFPRRSPSGRGEMAAPLQGAAPSIPHTQHSGADLGARSGADDPRRQLQKSVRPPPPVRSPQKNYMYKYAERGAIYARL